MRIGKWINIVGMAGLLFSAGCTGGLVPSAAPLQSASTAPTAAPQAVTPILAQASADPQQNEHILQDFQVDLDHNGTEERVQLQAGQDLMLQVGEQMEVVYPDFQYVPKSDYTIYVQRPKLDLIEGPSGEQLLLISVVWATNKIGSTANLWVYMYDSDELVQIWTSNELPAIQAVYKGGKFLDTEIPEYGLKQRLSLTAEDESWLEKAVPDAASKQKPFTLPGTTKRYSLDDLDGDGVKELLVERGICLADCAYYFSTQFLIYDLNNNTSKAFFENIPLFRMFPQENLKNIELYAYRSDSVKAQPELLTLFLDELDKKKFFGWLNAAGSPVALPDMPQHIYLLRFVYANGTKEEGKYLAYVESGGSFYAKPIHKEKELEFDKFSKESIASIMNILGKDYWYLEEKAPF